MEVFSPDLLGNLGLGAAAIYIFYRLIDRMMTEHRADRQADSELWRSEIRLNRETTSSALKELTDVIRNHK